MRWGYELIRGRRHAPALAVGLLLAVWLAWPAAAHHSFSMFDFKQRVTLEGVVTQFVWSNPHSFVELDVVAADGTVVHYSIESASPNILVRLGWKHNMLKAGDKVKLVIFPLRNGLNGGALQSATLADGRTCRSGLDADEKGQYINPTDIGRC